MIYACDELMLGDWLAPFTPEPMRAAGAGRHAGLRRRRAHSLRPTADRSIGAPGRLMVIDRGQQQRRPASGQRLTLFRPRSRRSAPAHVVGDAVVVAVRLDSATIRILRATDVIAFGDWAAPQRDLSASHR